MKRFFLMVVFFVTVSTLFAHEGVFSVLHAYFPHPASVYAATIGESACRTVTVNQGECKACFDSGGTYTAVGCIMANSPGEFVKSIITLGVGVGGGIAFLLMLFAGFQMMLSAGNPEKLHAAKELMGAAIAGLLIIIFSIFLLRFIGYDILGIPGFS